MTYANWTTRLLSPQAQDGQAAGAGPGQPPGGGEGDAQDAPASQAAAPPSLVGSRIGPYLITKRLGEGGVGAVYKGVDEMLRREVAVKVLHHEYASDPLFVARFSREAQLHAKLSHPNVATVHAFLHEGETQFMVMEYVAGISLDEFVRAGGPVPVDRALGIFRKALDGIAHAHRHGIVHRDIKPANIMLADSGAVKVMDFGIARALDSHEHLTRHGQVAGTAKAMAPEQIRGGEADVRSDIYSLGIVLFTMLAGQAPFDAESDFALMKAQLEQAPPSLRTFAPDVPAAVEAAVMKALQKDPSARFQTVADFARALDAWQVTDATAALPPARPAMNAATMARTAVNPALGEGPMPAASPAAAARTAVKEEADRPRDGAAAPAAAAKAAGAAHAPTAAKEERRDAVRRWRPAAHRRAVAAGLGLCALVAAGFVVGPRIVNEFVPVSLPPLPARILAQGSVAKAPVPTEVGPAPTLAVAPADTFQAASAAVAGAAAAQADAAPGSLAAAVSPAAQLPPPAAFAPPSPSRSLAIVRLAADGSAAPSTAHRFQPGERIRLRVAPSHDAHVYCYMQDEARRIVRFYPNRFSKSALVTAAAPLEIPGPMGFEIVANARNVTETIACFASERDVLGELPASVVGTDFEKLPATSLDQVRSAFARKGSDTPAEASFKIQFR